MFKIGDLVRGKQTGRIGIVIKDKGFIRVTVFWFNKNGPGGHKVVEFTNYLENLSEKGDVNV